MADIIDLSHSLPKHFSIAVLNRLVESARVIEELGNFYGTIEIKFMGSKRPHINIKEIKLPT